MTRFRKGQLTKDSYRIIRDDLTYLEGIISKHGDSDDTRVYDLLLGNIQDIFGKKIVRAIHKEDEG